MGRLEDYVEAVTRRLRADAELHMDIAHEVRTHLEDAVQEGQAGGLGEQESLDAGCTTHVTKPFKKAELLEAIKVYSRRRSALDRVISQ